jgi:hypothetical protein
MLLERGPVNIAAMWAPYGQHGPVLAKQSAGNHSLLALFFMLASSTDY